MANIVTVAVPAFIEESSEYDTQYKRTMKWNPEKGDFVRNAANQVVECTGEEGYMIWCMKVSMTERYSCLAYSNDIGVEMEDALAQDDEKTVESMVERTIRDALLVNPRTEWVRDFEFESYSELSSISAGTALSRLRGKSGTKYFKSIFRTEVVRWRNQNFIDRSASMGAQPMKYTSE